MDFGESEDAEISKTAAVLAAKWSGIATEAGLLESSGKLTKEQADSVRATANGKYSELVRMSSDFDPNSASSVSGKSSASTETGRKLSKLMADGDFRSYMLRRDPYTG